MSRIALLMFLMKIVSSNTNKSMDSESHPEIDMFDLSNPTTARDMKDFYSALEKQWKICVSCGIPSLGTTMRLDHASDVTGSVHPALIPVEYLLTRLVIIDVSSLTTSNPTLVLNLDIALQFTSLRMKPLEPTLILFKFGWTMNADYNRRNCVCKVPGLSFEIAKWIVANMSHVVGVATDAPTIESEETRDFTTMTVANVLGKNGVYIIENVYLKKRMPEYGCLAVSMPLKLSNTNVAPTRLIAFCPANLEFQNEVIVFRKVRLDKHTAGSRRVYDVNLAEILE